MIEMSCTTDQLYWKIFVPPLLQSCESGGVYVHMHYLYLRLKLNGVECSYEATFVAGLMGKSQ